MQTQCFLPLPPHSLARSRFGSAGRWTKVWNEPDISSLLDVLSANRTLLACTKICLIRLERNLRPYYGRVEANTPRKIANMINLTPSLARRVLDNPRLWSRGRHYEEIWAASVGMAQFPCRPYCAEISNCSVRVSKAMFVCKVFMLRVQGPSPDMLKRVNTKRHDICLRWTTRSHPTLPGLSRKLGIKPGGFETRSESVGIANN